MSAIPLSSHSNITRKIANELAVKPTQIEATIALLDNGATVPFIARYRKETTGHLDDTQLRKLEERLIYLRELEARRIVILASIEEQGNMTDILRHTILSAETKQTLEDQYLPYKPKRRTRAQIAREAGLTPLAEALLHNSCLYPEEEALKYINDKPINQGGIPNIKAALEGARDILTEIFSETPVLLNQLRNYLQQHGMITSTVIKGKENEAQEKFRDYYTYSESLSTIPSHRALAIFRGRNLGILQIKLGLGETLDTLIPHPCETIIAQHFKLAQKNQAADKWLAEVCHWCWRIKLHSQFEIELFNTLREQAEEEAIRIFSNNLQTLLLTSPAGPKIVMGIDPGIRTGCKVAVVDMTGKLLDTETIYPHEPRQQWAQSLNILTALCTRHSVDLIALGNGTASRETDKLVKELIEQLTASIKKVIVNEAGASIYSASELAAKEFPGLDVSLRGAVSIARRLQDPLAELVKIEPKSIGVGQYQHDVNQRALARSLDSVVEDCVNAVGVDLNTASVALLSRVSGLNNTLAQQIVAYRDTHGPFINRTELKKVPRLGNKAFEQAAGFLRINHGDNPLDRSAVHPEAYSLVKRILQKTNKPLQEIIGNHNVLHTLVPNDFINEQFGLPTVIDVLAELEKPGRDPRPEFKTAELNTSIKEIQDLKPGMILEGTITNVAAFGIFIDIGVHQDGFVHISAITNKFVKDPHDVVKVGQIVKVKVLDVDMTRQRISLSMRLNDSSTQNRTVKKARSSNTSARVRENPPVNYAMAEALAKLKKR